MSVLTQETTWNDSPTVSKKEPSPSLHAVVKGKDQDGEAWKEVADVVSYTATGAGFYMPRESKPGQLVSLMLPLPGHLRVYDHEKEFYRVWGVVQFCQPTTVDDMETCHLGVAFIGKNAPSSYHNDPARSYRISGMSAEGLWKIEAAKGDFKTRREIRYWKSFDVYLAVLDKEKRPQGGAKSITENISRSGAAVITSLDLGVGARVKFISEQYDYSGMAVVCNRQDISNSRVKLHLEFVENKFPVKKLDLTPSDPS